MVASTAYFLGHYFREHAIVGNTVLNSLPAAARIFQPVIRRLIKAFFLRSPAVKNSLRWVVQEKNQLACSPGWCCWNW